MALCFMKLGKFSKAVEKCDLVIAADSGNSKALCTKGRALIEIGDLDRARDSLTEAARLSPADTVVRKELGRLPALYKAAEEKEKRTWQEAFKKLK